MPYDGLSGTWTIGFIQAIPAPPGPVVIFNKNGAISGRLKKDMQLHQLQYTLLLDRVNWYMKTPPFADDLPMKKPPEISKNVSKMMTRG